MTNLIQTKMKSINQNIQVLRMLKWYKKGEKLVRELPLPNIELTELQELFQENPDNLMFE